jgi:hypothetical protein
MAITARRVPILDDGAPLGDADPNGQWKEAGRNYVWSCCIPPGGIVVELLERFDMASVRVPVTDRALHVIPAGRPYRLTHVYSFWRSTGADTVFVRTPAPAGTAYMLITGTSYSTYAEDRFSWMCAGCARELSAFTVPKSAGLNGLLTQSLRAARAFTADPEARTCRECGTVHPPAYGLDARADEGAEAAARLAN